MDAGIARAHRAEPGLSDHGPGAPGRVTWRPGWRRPRTAASTALARFARGLQEDLAAVTAGLTLEWSNGAIEGQITRLKLAEAPGLWTGRLRPAPAARLAGRLGAAGDGRPCRGHPGRPHPMASVGVWRGLPTAGGRGTPCGLLPRPRRSIPQRGGPTLVHQN